MFFETLIVNIARAAKKNIHRMASPLKLVFCGTPQFAVPNLQKLVEAGFVVHLVVTQPDRPKGRGMELTTVASQKVRVGTDTSHHPTHKNQTE